MSREKILNALTLARNFYFNLQVNQRLYVNAAVTLMVFLSAVVAFDPQSAKGLLFIFLAFWIGAIGYDLLTLYKKVYETLLGKGFLLILFSLCTNFAIVFSSQMVNEIVGIDPSKFPHTIALLSILSIPLFVAAGFSILYVCLLLLTPLFLMFHTFPDDKAKEILIPGYLATPTIPYHKTTRAIQFASFAIFCGVFLTLSKKVMNSYESFLSDTARTFIYEMEMYSKAQCNIKPNSRVAFLDDEMVLLGEEKSSNIIFSVRECKNGA